LSKGGLNDDDRQPHTIPGVPRTWYFFFCDDRAVGATIGNIMDVPAPRSESVPPSTPPSRGAAMQRAVAALVASAVLWIVVQSALQGSLAVRRGVEPGQAPAARLDLNQATLAELHLLPGVGPQLAKRIDAYRTLYGPFPHVEELRKVPGIGPQLLERIRPHVIVLSERGEEMAAAPIVRSAAVREPTENKSKVPAPPPLLVDLNEATSAEFDQLPGIGPKLAQRIIEARAEKRFTSVQDLRRVPGIGPKTFEKLRPHITVTP
jgi:competence protein ComEA